MGILFAKQDRVRSTKDVVVAQDTHAELVIAGDSAGTGVRADSPPSIRDFQAEDGKNQQEASAREEELTSPKLNEPISEEHGLSSDRTTAGTENTDSGVSGEDEGVTFCGETRVGECVDVAEQVGHILEESGGERLRVAANEEEHHVIPPDRTTAEAENTDSRVGGEEPSSTLCGETQAGTCVDAADLDNHSQDESDTDRLKVAVEEEEWENALHILSTAESVDASARTEGWNYSLLRAAAEGGALEVCRSLLERHADVNSRDGNGMTPLMGAVVGNDQPELVRVLLDAKADVEARTEDGFTALAWAWRLNSQSATTKLLQEADVNGGRYPVINSGSLDLPTSRY